MTQGCLQGVAKQLTLEDACKFGADCCDMRPGGGVLPLPTVATCSRQPTPQNTPATNPTHNSLCYWYRVECSPPQKTALGVAGRPRLHQVLIWYNLAAAPAAGRAPFDIKNRLWLSRPVLTGNATVIVSELLQVLHPPPIHT
jgi:hypothetical protein